jgi:hypothetical protein
VPRVLLASICALLTLGQAGPLRAQMLKPETNFHIAVNGVFAFCPRLIRGAAVPEAVELSGLGLTEIASPKAGQIRYEGLRGRDNLQIWYDTSDRRCIVHYGGAGYASIAGAVRDSVEASGLKRLLDSGTEGSKGEVFEGAVPGFPLRTRIIIVEDRASKTASISYTEKAGS